MLATAFFIPTFGKVVPVLIGVILINWIADGRFLKNITGIFRERQRGFTAGFAILYLVYAAGLMYTSNFTYGWFDLEVKLSLLLFPLVIATSPWPVFTAKDIRQILQAYIAGCFLGALILLGHAAIGAMAGDQAGSFYYTQLAWYFHSSYLAMYYNFAIAILVFSLLTNKTPRRWTGPAMVALVLFFVMMVFLLSSKAGVFTLVIVIVLSALYSFTRIKRPLAALAILASGVAVFLAGFLLTPYAFSRFSAVGQAVRADQQVNRTKSESNADRMAVWLTATGIIKTSPLFGVGTGDVKDALMEGYRARQVLPAIEHKFNAHNQYLQTTVTLGLMGLLVLVATLLLPAVRAFRTRQDLYLIFLVIFAFNILVESMLEIQAGVVFYAFFNIILFTSGTTGDPVS
jgi:O-antigen ligase